MTVGGLHFALLLAWKLQTFLFPAYRMEHFFTDLLHVHNRPDMQSVHKSFISAKFNVLILQIIDLVLSLTL
jgi:hypothetical protein